MKRALLLGAGLVSRPLVRHLLEYDDVVLTVADRDGGKAAEAIGRHPHARAAAVSTADAASLEALVRDCDLVVSLLPATEHAAVAKVALAHRKPLITTSYVSPEMRALDGEARAAGVLLLNEIGLDPGLDHMSAMRAIRDLRAGGHKLVSFKSSCGGLPAPDANTNPWGYKFSWSPRGVLLAGRNPARWLADGRVVEVDGAELFSCVAPYVVPGVGTFEVYPNRDALAYVATYGLEGVLTMFRGTLRYPGWCETLSAISRLGLLDVVERGWRIGTTCEEFMEAFAAEGHGPLKTRVALRAGIDPGSAVMSRLEWVGLFGTAPIGVTSAAPLDVLCARMQGAMSYAAGERDMIVLRHEFSSVGPDGRPATTVSTLASFGDPRGDQAMARTVALPAAVAARLVLDGKIGLSGVRIPVDPEIYDPVLSALAAMGIVFEEQRTTP